MLLHKVNIVTINGLRIFNTRILLGNLFLLFLMNFLMINAVGIYMYALRATRIRILLGNLVHSPS